MDGAISENPSIINKNKKIVNDKPNTTAQNHDIRSFFNKSTGPSTLTTNKRIIQVIQPYLNDIDENNYKLRERKIINYKTKFELSEDSRDEQGNKDSESQNSFSEDKSLEESVELENNSDEDNGSSDKNLKNKKRKAKFLKKSKKNDKKQKKEIDQEHSVEEVEGIQDDGSRDSFVESDSDGDYIELRGAKSFQKFRSEALQTIHEAELELKRLTKEFYVNEQRISETKSKFPDRCIPVCADIREFKFKNLAEKQLELSGQLFDIIMMDPPWQLSSSQPTRGVAIAYDTLNDSIITDIPIPKLQSDGFIFIWTINAKFKVTLDLIKQWGYRYFDEIVWVKQTVNGKIAKGHGYYLQHTKETCLIGIKGNPKYQKNVLCDVIFSKRRGQSQKPEEIYVILERLVPNGYYLEIFGRRNNLRDKWVTIGNEI